MTADQVRTAHGYHYIENQQKIKKELDNFKNRYTVPVEFIESDIASTNVGTHLVQSEHRNTLRSLHQDSSPNSAQNFTPLHAVDI